MSDPRKTILMRAYLLYVLVLIFAVVIAGRIVYLQWGQDGHWKKMASQSVYKYENIEAHRGNIYSDDESLLATSVLIYDIAMDVNPKVVPDSIFFSEVDSLSYCLGRLFGKEKAYYQNKLVSRRRNFPRTRSGYVLLEKNISYNQLKNVQQFPIFRRGRYKGGLVVSSREVRECPYKSLARRTIGYVQLAVYDVSINLSNARIPEQEFTKYADTLALCMYNLFHDGHSKDAYKKLIDESYRQHKNIKKRIDSRQLKRLTAFPLLSGLDETTGLRTKKIKDEYLVGLEGAYNDQLSGRDGTRIMKKLGAGTYKEVTDGNLVEPVNGYDIYTSLDINLQDVAENALRKCLDSNQAQWGCVVLMEVKTGLVKAIVNLTRDTGNRYYEMRNYAIGEPIEPGSTFKLASVIATLEEGKYDTASRVPTGTGVVGRRKIEDSYPPGYGVISLAHAFEKSSNLGISYVTYNTFRNQVDKYKAYLTRMGITSPLGIEIAGEVDPSMPINVSDMETIPYGYVVKMTPIQILAFYNAVANDGVYIKPRFVKGIGRAGKMAQTTSVKVLHEKICSDATLKQVRTLLEGVVIRGTAHNIRNSVYPIAGKTGTARIYENGEYIMRYVASFVGYFPADKPEYSCIVVVHRASGSEYTGSQIAAPVFKEISDKVFATRLDLRASQQSQGIARQAPPAYIARQQELSEVYSSLGYPVYPGGDASTWVRPETKLNGVLLRPTQTQSGKVPDVRGMGARDAVYLLEKLGLRVTIKGKGSVVRQSLQPGTGLRAGSAVTLELEM